MGEKHIKVMSFNVSGVPVIGNFQGSKKIGGFKKSSAVGRMINGVDADLIGVQEDFNYHQGLAVEMTLFPYQTYSSGGLPLGDGLNIFSKHPIYNVSRNNWEKLFGVLCGANDRLSKKGFVYAAVALETNVLVDFIVLHADAGKDKYSVRARKDNFRQLREFIGTLKADRPLIVVGDCNTTVFSGNSDDIYHNLLVPTGLKDAWVELYNNGDYSRGGNNHSGESIDRVLYRNGGGVTLEPSALEHVHIADEAGDTYTDHQATCARLAYTVDADGLSADRGVLKPPEPFNPKRRSRDHFLAVCRAALLVLTHLYELFYLIFTLKHELKDNYPNY